MRILVTGSQGYLGSRLLSFLKVNSSQDHVVGASRYSSGPSQRACQFENVMAVRALLKFVRPEIIFHCVGTTSGNSWDLLVRAHLVTTANLLEAVRLNAGAKPRVVLVGSAAEYGSGRPGYKFSEQSDPRPETPYGYSKYLQTIVAMGYARLGVTVLVARLFNLLAPDAPSSFAVARVLNLLNKIPRGSVRSIRTGPLSSVRDFISLEEAFQALSLIGFRGKAGEIYNVCSGRGTRMEDVFNALAEGAGVKARWLSAGSGSIKSTTSFSVGSCAKIRRHTGWIPKGNPLEIARGFSRKVE